MDSETSEQHTDPDGAPHDVVDPAGGGGNPTGAPRPEDIRQEDLDWRSAAAQDR